MTTMTRNQRRSVERRFVGRLDDGRKAALVRKGDTTAMVRAIFDKYDDALVVDDAPELVDWCPHNSQYIYDHGCDEWCERPVPRFVWVAQYPARP